MFLWKVYSLFMVIGCGVCESKKNIFIIFIFFSMSVYLKKDIWKMEILWMYLKEWWCCDVLVDDLILVVDWLYVVCLSFC